MRRGPKGEKRPADVIGAHVIRLTEKRQVVPYV
jgi:hypothetical protein